MNEQVTETVVETFTDKLNQVVYDEIVFGLVAIAAIVLVALKLKEIISLQSKFKQSIVLVPLYRKRYSIIFGLAVLFGGDIASIVFIIRGEPAIPFICLFAVCTAFMALLVFMLTFKLAIMDKGILVPYRFIEWHHLYDYYIDGYKVSFGGNQDGHDTLTSNTPPMKFNVADLEKIQYILAKNKVKHKSNMR